VVRPGHAAEEGSPACEERERETGMAVRSSHPTRTQGILGSMPDAIRAFARLFSAICSIGSVQKVGLSSDEAQIDLWVLMRESASADEERIYLLERDYRKTVGAFPLELHVIPLDAIDERNLPPAETVFER
jgi:hypothetical protein